MATPDRISFEDIAKFVNDRITDDETRIFSDTFLSSLVQKVKYPIKGADAMTWIGYLRPDNLKRAIIANLEQDVDYEIKTESSSRVLTFNLTLDAFKLIAHVSREPRARKTRACAYELSRFVDEYIASTVTPPTVDVAANTMTVNNVDLVQDVAMYKEKYAQAKADLAIAHARNHELAVKTIDKLLEERKRNSEEIIDYELQRDHHIVVKELFDCREEMLGLRAQIVQLHLRSDNAEAGLLLQKQNVARANFTQAVKFEQGECVYIFRESENKHKVGFTLIDANRRNNAHRTSSSSGMIVYTKRCNNAKLLERMVHVLLDQYRDVHNREWFTVDFNIAKAAIEVAHYFTTEMRNRLHTICDNDFVDRFKAVINTLPKLADVIDPMGLQEPTEPQDDENDDNEEPQELDEITVQEDVPLQGVNPPLDFPRFISDCCIIDPSKTAIAVEVVGAHRLWARSASEDTAKALHKYMNANFKKAKVYNEECKATLASYTGFSLKPMTYQKSIPPDEYDAFIEARCNVDYVARACMKDVVIEFEQWKRESTPDTDFTMCAQSKQKLVEALSTRFLNSIVYMNKQGNTGYFGFGLKSQHEAEKFTGFKLAEVLKKPVEEVNIATGAVTRTFPSQGDAAVAIGCNAGSLSKYIKYKTTRGDFTYRFAVAK